MDLCKGFFFAFLCFFSFLRKLMMDVYLQKGLTVEPREVDELQTRFVQSDDGNTVSPTSRINVCLGLVALSGCLGAVRIVMSIFPTK